MRRHTYVAFVVDMRPVAERRKVSQMNQLYEDKTHIIEK